MLSDQAFMRLHIEALFTHDDRSRLLYVNEPTAAVRRAPRFFLGRTAEGAVWRFRADLPDDLVERLEAMCLDEPMVDDLQAKPRHFDEYVRLLEAHGPVQEIRMGPAYRFPDESAPPSARPISVTSQNIGVLQSKLAEWVPDVPYCRPFLAIVQDGCGVSLCCSVRITAQAHEAGVETLSTFRNRGYAAEVAAGWAAEVRKLGVIPLYSTSWDNAASQSVAKKLGLVTYGADFHVL